MKERTMIIRTARRLALTSAFVAAWAATGCSSDATAGHRPIPNGDAAAAPENTGSAASEQARACGSNRKDGSPSEEPRSPSPPEPKVDLYDPQTIPSFELMLDADAVAVLSSPDEATKKTWVHGRFRCGKIELADVGVRLKGASTFRVLPEKPSLKVKFNKWVKKQKLHGLEELTLNNMVTDPTFLAERLAYHVFRSANLPAPKANTAKLSINGEDYGIFANVETPDENFLARVFGGRGKTLYEVNWGGSWMPEAGYDTGFDIDVADPSAPAGTMPDADRLVAAVAAAKAETLLADLDRNLDTKQWLRHSAAEAVTGHFDGYAYGLWASHNYFLAGDVDGKFSLVPWSTDLTFSDRSGATDAANPSNTTVLVTCKASACWDAYKTEVRSLLEIYEGLDLVSLARQWHDQIEPLVAADPKRSISLEYHDSDVATLYSWLAARPALVRSQLGL